MTGSELYAYILRTFKRTDKSTEVYESITDTIRNIRLRYPFENFKYEGYITPITAVGEYKFALPTDFGHLITEIRLIDDDDSVVLTKISKAKYDELLPNPDYSNVDTDKPTCFCIYAGMVYLYPVPDDITYQYSINYSLEDESSVTSATEDVAFSNRYREVLKFGTLARLYSDLGFDEESAKWEVKFEREIDKIIQNDESNIRASTVVRYNDN